MIHLTSVDIPARVWDDKSMTKNWVVSGEGFIKIVGAFTISIQPEGEYWRWSVEVPGDEGDSDLSPTLDHAIRISEEAMALIVDEMFMDIEMMQV